MRFNGVIPPLITPFTESGAVDFKAHQRNVRRWNESALAGYLVLGSNSEAVHLSEAEKLELIELTAAAAPDRLLLAGTGMDSTAETIRLTRLAAERGARAALILTPYFYRGRMNDDALIRHFEQVAEASTIPILIYNVPKYTGLNVSLRVVETLSRHPNIVGMKDSSGNIAQLVQFQEAAAEGFQVLVGTASVWYPALVLGCEAGIMALANCAPRECVRVQELFSNDRWEEAEYLYRRLVPLNQAVTATYGVAGLKYACSRRGYHGGFVRGPLAELTEAECQALDRILQAAEVEAGA